jgi:hypothetical protein
MGSLHNGLMGGHVDLCLLRFQPCPDIRQSIAALACVKNPNLDSKKCFITSKI